MMDAVVLQLLILCALDWKDAAPPFLNKQKYFFFPLPSKIKSKFDKIHLQFYFLFSLSLRQILLHRTP